MPCVVVLDMDPTRLAKFAGENEGGISFGKYPRPREVSMSKVDLSLKRFESGVGELR